MLRFNRPQFLGHIPKLLIALLLVAPTAVVRSSPAQAAPNATLFVSNSFDSGAGSLREAILQLNANPGADTISINFNLTTLFLATALPTITDPVTIRANGGFVIDGQNLRRGLAIGNVPVSIRGVTIQRAAVFGNSLAAAGGGILSQGPLTLTDVTILNSSAWLGGGVSGASTVTINGGRIEGNSATTDGGAIHAVGGVVISGTTIINNYCSGPACKGGGLYSFSTAVINDGVFEGNHAVSDGGAIQVMSGLVMTGTTLRNNYCSAFSCNGGGVTSASTMILTNTTFSDNHAQIYGGGAVGISFKIFGGIFEGNHSKIGAGAVYAASESVISGTTFSDNYCLASSCSGGAVYGGQSLIMTNTTYLNNNAGASGGGVHAQGRVEISGGSFVSNTAGSYGGGLYSINLVLTNSTFISNTAGRGGGGANVFGSAQLTNARFANNRTGPADTLQTDGGGGLLAPSTIGLTHLRNVTFINNQTQSSPGGGLRGENVQIEGGLFEQNTGGGGLRAQNLVLTGTRFINNATARTDCSNGLGQLAGGAYVVGDVRATGGIFERNEGPCAGGLRSASAMLTNTHFISNTSALGTGGASTGLVRATGVRFAGNRSLQNGAGGLDVTAATTLDNCVFADNEAGTGAGGALRVTGVTTITSCAFTNNRASTTGGAIQATGDITVTLSTLIGNQANDGGGISHGAGNGRFENLLLARNNVAGSGAALFFQGSGATELQHLTIAHATPVTKTAITSSKAFMFIGNTIVANHALGINIVSGSVALLSTLFFNNTINTQGSLLSNASAVAGDPRFVNPALDNYHLRDGSPAVNAGVASGIAVDFDGDARPSGGGVDIGYDELPPFQRRVVVLPMVVR